MRTSRELKLRAVSSTVLAGAFVVALGLPALAADVTPARLANADAEPQNWLMGFQNYSSHRYSRLNQITKANVANLKVAFTVPLATGLSGRTTNNMENYPLVDDGYMYILIEEINDSLPPACEAAVDGCPEQALRIEG